MDRLESGKRINQSIAVPRSFPDAFWGFDGYGPVFTAGPDAKEVGAVGTEFAEYLFGLCEVDILTFTDKSEILADGKEGSTICEFQKAAIFAERTKETFAR